MRNLEKEFARIKEGMKEVKDLIMSLDQNPKYRDRYTEVFKMFESTQSDFITKE